MISNKEKALKFCKTAHLALQFFCMTIIIISIISCCCSREFKEVKLELYGLVLPGRIISGNNVVAKYVWQGGGNLREIARVNVQHIGNTIVITPYGLLDLRNRAFPCDIFLQTDTISLGSLTEGTFIIILEGSSCTYSDTLVVPSDGSDGFFQFSVTAVNRETGHAVSGLPLDLELYQSCDTLLKDTTDSSGHAIFTFSMPGVDSLVYAMYSVYTWAKVGIPEIITIDISE
jgi:hypothetical protein